MPDNNIPLNREHEHIFEDTKKSYKPEAFVSQPLSEIPFGRYDVIYPGLDNEEYYAQKQSFLDKVGNGIAKAAGTFTTSFLEGTVGVINGLGAWASTGKFSSFYDNEFNRKIDDINKSMEDALPNYYTQAEKDAAWYSPTNLLSGNFLGDKLLKNLGYSYGAILGGAAWGSLLKGIGLTSRLIKAGQGLKAIEAVESAMQGASKLDRFGAVNKALNSTWNSVKGTIGEGLTNTDRLIISSTGMLGEATIEALQATNEFRNKLIEDYKRNYGTAPSEESMREINKYADSVGNTVFGTNAALLTFSNYIQLPKILGSSKTAEKRAINNIIKEGDSPLSKFVAGTPSTGNVLSPIANILGTPGRFLNKNILGPARLAFSTGEAIEEGLQYAAQTGSEDFFKRAYSGKEDADDLLGAISNIMTKGVNKAFSDKEGIESILIGGFSGGIQKVVSNIKERGIRGTGGVYGENTKSAIDALNKTNVEQALKDGAKYAAIGMQSQQLRQQAIVNNDTLGEKDYEKDFELSYILPRVKYGKVDSVSNDLSYYRQQASTDSGFQQLKDAGVVNKEEKREKFLERLNSLENTANSVNSIYEKLEDKYGGVVDKDGKRVYTSEVIDKMAYAIAKVSDYDKRSVEILNSLTSKGINPSGLVSAINSSPTFKEKKYRDVMKESSVNEQINEINKQIAETGEIDPEDTIREVGDFTDMVFLKQRYIDDINEMKVTPSEFESEVSPPDEEAQQPEGVKKTVKIFRKDLNKEFELVIGKEYVGSSPPTPSKEGPEFKEYRKFTIVSMSEDGKTLSIKDQKGKVKESSFQEFEDFMNKYGWMGADEIKANPDLQFAIEAAGKIFTYQLGGGKTKKGALEYDMKTKALKFVTLDGKSNYYVKRSQFVAKEGFKLAQIYPDGALSKSALAALSQPVTVEELKKKYSEKDEILNDVLKSSTKRIAEINAALSSARAALDKTNEELEALTTNKKGEKKKRFDKVIRKTINSLVSTKEKLEKQITTLEEERDELEAISSYFKELLVLKAELPEESSEIIKELEEDLNAVDKTIELNSDAVEKSKKLLASVEETLQNALAQLDKFVKQLAKSNPKVPLSVEALRIKLEKTLGEDGAKKYIDDRLDITNLVIDLEEQISDFSEDLNIPQLTSEAEKLRKEVEDLQFELDKLLEDQDKKTKVIETFKRAAESFQKRLEEEAIMSNNMALQKAILGTKYGGPQISIPDKNYEGARKSDMNVLNGSIGVMRGKAHQIRANNFGFRFNTLKPEVRERIFGVYVTAQNEKEFGMEGLIDKFQRGDDGLIREDIKREDVIVLVVVHQNQDGKIIPVDEFGIPIPKELNSLETGVYQVIPDGELKWSSKYGGESMFRDAENEGRNPIIKALTEQYKAKREKILADKNSYKKIRTIDASFGNMEPVIDPATTKPDFNTRTSVEDAGLISKSKLEKEKVIMIPTLDTVASKGTVTFNTPLGMVFLELPNGLVKLKNKKHSAKEAETIYKAILKYAELVYENKTDEPEAKRILTWLQSVVYWGIPDSKKGRKEPGYNSIFFERSDVTKQMMLSISGKESGKELFKFSPSALRKEKNNIIALISGMYNNVNNSIVGKITQSYEEILSIAEDGTIESRIWKNYQSYLLSNTTPEGGERASESIPLATIARPLSSKEDVNRKDIYFYVTDNVDNFTMPSPKKKEKEGEKEGEKKPVKGKMPVKKDVPKTESRNGMHIEGELDFNLKSKMALVSTDTGKKFYFVASDNVNPKTLKGIIINTEDGDIKEIALILKAKIEKERKEKGLSTGEKEVRDEVVNFMKRMVYSTIKPYIEGDMVFSASDIGASTKEDLNNKKKPSKKKEEEPPPFEGDESEDIFEEEDEDEVFSAADIGASTKEDLAKKKTSNRADVRNAMTQVANEEDDADDDIILRLVEERLERFKPENWTKVEEWLKANFPRVPVYRVKNIIKTASGRQAWGMFKDGAIYIYENAEVGTAYHEVFHAVWRMFTDKEEQRKILAELKARKGTFYDIKLLKDVKYSEATNRQLEEVLAEEFRDYVQFKKIPAKPSEGRPYILKLFSDLITFIKEFFFGKESSSKMNEFFKRIDKGEYKGSFPYEQSLSYANRGIIDVDEVFADEDAVLSLVGITDIERNDIIQEMIYQSLAEVVRTDDSLFKGLSLSKSYLDNNVKEAILRNLSKERKMAAKLESKLGKDVADMEKARILKLAESINAQWELLTKRYEEYLKSYNIEFDENNQAQLSDEDRSGRDNWADATKIDSFKKAHSAVKLLLSTIPKTRMVKGEVKRVRSTVGGSVLLPVTQTFATLMSKLYSSYNLEDMISRLYNLAKENPDYRSLYRRITRDETVTFSDDESQLPNFDKIDKVHGAQLLSAFWNTFKKQAPDVMNVFVLDNGEVVVGAANLATAARQLKNNYMNEIVYKARNEKDGLFKRSTDKKKKVYIGNTEKARRLADLVRGGKATRPTRVKFLNELGISFKESYLSKMSDQEKRNFDNIVNGIYASVLEAEEIVTFSGKTLSIDGRLLQLALLQTKIDNPEFNTTYFNISGERSQTFIGPNPVSEFSNFLKGLTRFTDEQVSSSDYSYLLTDSFAQGSNLLQRMFNSEGEPIVTTEDDNSDLLTVGIVGGISDDTNGKRKESSKLTYRERLIQELNLNLKGWYLNLVPADATIEHMVKMGNGVSMKELERGDREYEKVFEIFGEYFKAELDLVREKNRKVNEEANRNPKDFRFFDDIFDDKLKKDILAMTDKSAEEVYNTPRIKSRINEAIEKKLENEAALLDQLLRKYGIVSVEETPVGNIFTFDKVTNGDKKFQRQSDANYNTTLKFLSINYMIANIELHKLTYSDPYQYSDELKRIKQFLSPRQMLVANSPKMSSLFDKVWNQGYKEGDAGYTKFNQEYFRSAVHDDVEGIKDLPGYDVFKETDGSGIATFKAYRHFRIRASNWNDNEESQYRYDMAWEKQDRKTEKLTKEEQDILDRGNPQVTSAYTTQKPSIAGTQLDEDGNYPKDNYIVLDKFSLYPLSYRVMKEINPTSNALKLYDKMMNEDIDYIVPPSARKVGANASKDGKKKITHESYSDKGEFNTAPYKKENITNIPFSIMAVQADVPSKEDYNVTRGSQITKLVTMDFLQGGVPIDFMPEEKSFEKRYEMWNSPSTKKSESKIYTKIKNNENLLKELIDIGYKNTLKEFGITEIIGKDKKKQFVIEDFEKVGAILKDEILKREANDNVSDSLKYFIKQKSVIEATPAYQQVRNILYSIADRNFISQKINGSMKVQIPSTFFESERVEMKEINGKKGYVSDTLKMYEKGGKNIIELMLPRWFESSLSDEELINYFNNTEEGKKQLTAIAGVAFRIPTQNQNSFDSFVIKKFLPKEFGDNVVIPAALVEKAGSDFDIDKLSLYLKNVYVKEGKPKLIPYFGIGEKAKLKIEELYDKGEFLSDKEKKNLERYIAEETFNAEEFMEDESSEATLLKKIIGVDKLFSEEEMTKDFMGDNPARDKIINALYKKSIENAYIQSMQDLIEDELNYDKLIKKNSAKRLKDLATNVAKKTQGGTFDYKNVGNLLSRRFMSSLRHSFVTGKYAIGIAAVNQTNHSLNQRQLVFMNPERIPFMSDADRFWIGKDSRIKFKKYNSVRYKGKSVPTLSGIVNPDKEYISDIIGMFIDGYVDIPKGPWIMELGATPNVASTYLFLVKIGVPLEDVVFFMNQPIIRQYLEMIENSGYSWLFIDDYVNLLDGKYGGDGKKLTDEEIRDFSIPNTKSLENNVGKKLEELNKEERKTQRLLLKEFLKYAKMSEQMFHVTQGSNFDTANFNDPLLVFKKLTQLVKAQNTIFSAMDEDGKVIPAVDALLKNSFIGKLVTSLVDVRDAFSEILTSDKKRIRNVIEKVLLPYTEMGDRPFVKIARKAVTDLFDWAVQTDQGFNKYILDLLVNKDNVSEQVFRFVKSIPETDDLYNNEVVRTIKSIIAKRDGGVNNIEIVATDNRIYDQNNIIYGFRQLKEYFNGLEDTDANRNLYERIKQLAVVQSGLSSSPISFTSLLPYEDFEEIYGATLNKLASIEKLEDFYNLGVFERNNWNNDDITPYERARWRDSQRGPVYNQPMEYLPNQVKDAVNKKIIPPVLRLNSLSRSARKEYIVYSWEKDIEVLNEDERRQAIKTNTVRKAINQKKAEMRLRGDYSFINKALMRKVKHEDSKAPYTTSYVNKDGISITQYVYVAVNAWGDSFRANEFYDVDKPSVLENGFIKVEKPVTDSAVIRIFEQKKQEPVSKPSRVIPETGGRVVAIIGTAGRTKVPSLKEWQMMLRDAESRVKPDDILISGGAAFSDHIAVNLFLDGKVAGLKLRLPAPIKDGKFVGGYKTAGGTANYYHESFSRVIGVNTIKQIQDAIDKGAEVTYETEVSNSAMFMRNKKVAAESNSMIAYTYGEGREPADGGTLDTWKAAKYSSKTHVNISRIKAQPLTETRSLAMQPDNISKIKAGTKTITNRTEKFPDDIYKLPDGTQVKLTYQGQADVQYIGDSVIVTANDTNKTWSADEFAKAEGFKDWSNFQKNQKFSKNFIDGKQSRYIYAVSPISPTQPNERIAELENKMKTKGLGPDEIKEREQLMANKGRQIKKEC